MTGTEIQKQIIRKVEALLGVSIADIRIPLQGMDSEVFLAADRSGKEYAIKSGRDAGRDILAYKLLEENKVAIPVPKLLGSFVFEEKMVVVLEKINFPLLEFVAVPEMHKYIPSMIENLKKIHQVRSDRAGFLDEQGEKRSWKEIMLAKFDGNDPVLDWNKVARRDGLDSALVLASVEHIIEKIRGIEFIEDAYSFLHTDFNQRNLFADPESGKIAGIIDWGEAMFGDPVYDFSRIRMFIWHFDLGDVALQDYYGEMSFGPRQKQLEELYWLSRIIEYLAYYSEELNDFTSGRIKLHQDFLRAYKWQDLVI